jgi:hypothetical protein
MEFGAFAVDLGAALDSHWVETYCSHSTYSVENAARCLLGGQANEPVLTAIAGIVGDDRKAIARLAGGATHAQ